MINRTITCMACENKYTEQPAPGQPNPGFPGWGALRGVAVSGMPDPTLCPGCLGKAAVYLFGEKIEADQAAAKAAEEAAKKAAKPAPKKDPPPARTIVHHTDDGDFLEIGGELVAAEFIDGKWRPVEGATSEVPEEVPDSEEGEAAEG